MDPDIAAVRAELDAIDEELIALLARRRAAVVRLFARKAALGLPRVDRRREAELLADRARMARERGVPEEVAAEVFAAALRMSHAIV